MPFGAHDYGTLLLTSGYRPARSAVIGKGTRTATSDAARRQRMLDALVISLNTPTPASVTRTRAQRRAIAERPMRESADAYIDTTILPCGDYVRASPIERMRSDAVVRYWHMPHLR